MALTAEEVFIAGSGHVYVADVGNALSRITDATLEATLAVAGEGVRVQRKLDAAPTRIAIIAMGRYGGFELSYGSDADVMFVQEPAEMGPVTTAVFDDTCGNLIQIASQA